LDFKTKEVDCGFIIISPEHNIGRVLTTVRSIKNYHEDRPFICITDKSVSAPELKELKEICPTYKGGDTIISLINAGFKKGHKGWNMLMMAGATTRKDTFNKYSLFMEDEKDIFFPIVVDYNRDSYPVKVYSSFDDCSLNGLMIHQKTFKKVGDLTDNPMEISRLWWAMEAQDKGIKFKSILGAKMC